ncbi:hypothetical protein FACS1894206_10040 [Deltaproteobacteria bacterium]|nr:hypothetical protein FACS1894206_10040 [Deltaproteobacteria bacterium]
MTVQTGRYHNKLVSAEKAVKIVKSGDYVDYNFCLAQPVALDMALAKRVDELCGVMVRGAMRMLPLHIVDADPTGEHFSYASWHLTGLERKLCDAGRCTHIPMVYRNMPLFYRKSLDVDVALFSVPPMDDDGYFSCSLTNSATRAIVEKAKHVVLEVNEKLPPVRHGRENSIHISEVTICPALCSTTKNCLHASANARIALYGNG